MCLRPLQHQIARTIDMVLSFITSFLTGVYPKTPQQMPTGSKSKVYYGNHTSNGDFLLLWISLPKRWRMNTRPVAAADYWLKNPLRRFIIDKVFNGFLVDRTAKDGKNIVAKMHQALLGGQSLIIFPEGVRNMDNNPHELKPFKSGIYHLAQYDPQREFIPMWISNMNYVLPKGHLLPVPLLCKVIIGEPLTLQKNESKEAFLKRASDALLALAPNTTTAMIDTNKDT